MVESGLVDLWMKEMGDLAKQENKKRIRKVNLCLGKGPYIHGPLLKKGASLSGDGQSVDVITS